MKHLTLISIGLSLLIIGSIISVISLKREINKEKTKIEVNIGKRVVIEKDTLLIVDYSIYNDTYTLSDGKIISFELIKTIPLIK